MDPNFAFGCNDALLIDDSEEDEGHPQEEQIKRKAARKHLCKVAIRNRAQHSSVCLKTKLLKRSPLPTAIAWNGKSGLHPERFIDQLARHVTMQTHMGYILLEDIALLWLKDGDATLALGMAMQRKFIHVCNMSPPNSSVLGRPMNPK